MECPFKIPAKYEMKITTTEYVVIDAERKVIAKCNYKDDALYIQQVINSHEKLESLKKASIKFQCDHCHDWLTVTVQEIIGSDRKLEQALKEAEKE